jgi:galactokinase
VPTVEERAKRAYRTQFGGEAEVVASAPGRINLIGEHTDYNGGFVLPCAIDKRVAVAIGRGGNALYSDDLHKKHRIEAAPGHTWADYPSGVKWALVASGYDVPPFHAAYAGNVPRGAGLSSSAAIECATGVGLDALFGLGIGLKQMALLMQQAENGFVGVNSGIMDQYASLLSQRGAALFVDCRTLEARAVPLDLEAAGLSLVICDTHVPRTLAGTGYNERRATCELAARELGVQELRDATVTDLERLSGVVLKRARHVVTEDERVLQAVKALGRKDFLEFGRLMYASHASLRDDYEVSVPALDLFVDTARETGALGARLTGAGFGGCALALIESSGVRDLESAVEERFRRQEFKAPSFYSFRPEGGAQVMQ